MHGKNLTLKAFDNEELLAKDDETSIKLLQDDAEVYELKNIKVDTKTGKAIVKVKLRPKSDEDFKTLKDKFKDDKIGKLFIGISYVNSAQIPQYKTFLDDEEFEVKNTTAIHIYHDGTISKLDYKELDKITYIYHDKNGKKHDLGNTSVLKVKKWEKKNKATKEDFYLIKMEDLMSYKNGEVKFKFKFSSTKRRYTNPYAMATFMGAMLNVGYEDFTSTGFSNKDGSPGVSNSHINGNAGDILYLNTKKSNTTTLLEDAGFDYDRMIKFINALDKFGWGKGSKSMLSEKFDYNGKKNTLLPHTIHYKKKNKDGSWTRHHNHLHINGLNESFK
jgi:hypothetical protein